LGSRGRADIVTSIERPIAFGTIRAMPEEPIARKESVDRYVATTCARRKWLSITLLPCFCHHPLQPSPAPRARFDGLAHWTIATETLRVLDQLLIVLMLVEILHTVRIPFARYSARGGAFPCCRLIASIRRVLIISLQMTALTREGKWSTDGASIFQSSMIELAAGDPYSRFGVLNYAAAPACSGSKNYGGLAMTTRPTREPAETSRAIDVS